MPFLAAALLLAVAPSVVTIDVVVPLCDSALIACGRGAAGDPESLEANLYWGAAYGAERYLTRARSFGVARRMDRPYADRPAVLRVVELVRAPRATEREVRLRLIAYRGTRIDEALADFLVAAGGGTDADLVVWAGHDRLMDVPAPPVPRAPSAKPVIVLACASQRYFGPVLEALGARPLVLTRTFMAPEAYLLEAIATAVARRGLDPATLRAELVRAYARFQRITPRAASSVFSR